MRERLRLPAGAAGRCELVGMGERLRERRRLRERMSSSSLSVLSPVEAGCRAARVLPLPALRPVPAEPPRSVPRCMMVGEEKRTARECEAAAADAPAASSVKQQLQLQQLAEGGWVVSSERERSASASSGRRRGDSEATAEVAARRRRNEKRVESERAVSSHGRGEKPVELGAAVRAATAGHPTIPLARRASDAAAALHCPQPAS